MKRTCQYIDLTTEQIEAVLIAVKSTCQEEHYQLIKTLIGNYRFILEAITSQRLSLRKLAKMLFGPTKETRDKIFPDASDASDAPADDGQADASNLPLNKDNDESVNQPPPKGHGRRPADDYPNAERKQIPHPTLTSGDPCPECIDGKVYDNVEPYVIIRFKGQAPIHVTINELEKLRCNLCGTIFSAPPPPEMGSQRWDESAQAIIALCKYGAGTPFNRLAKLQDNRWDACTTVDTMGCSKSGSSQM